VPATSEEPNFLLAAIGSTLYVLVPAANAQDADAALNVSSPAVTRIKQSMGARFGELEKFFASGAIGLTKDGMVDVRDLNAVALPDRATVKRLVSEDNATARSCTPKSRRPATTRSGKLTSRRASRSAGSPREPSPAGTTRATMAPGNRSSQVR
jgi:hypothetical protein